ncbi:hypothetical protein R1flu_007951 [Riccia fluitans]|uniref:Uncharacterized protein n=1 Tax=Riccia fluitans TaxID=41844 RepID=A0ABD1XE24_9MARC
MSGMRRRSRDNPMFHLKERPSQHRSCATSPNYELPHDEAMKTIDQLVQGEETNSGIGATVERSRPCSLWRSSL